MSRRDQHLDALLKQLGAAYYQTLHGDAAASDVAHAVASVEAVETAVPPGEPPVPARGERRTGRWQVKDVMRSPPVTVGERATATQIARLMSDHRLSCLPVVDGQGRAIGVVSEEDLLRFREGGRPAPWWLPGRSRKADGQTAAGLMTSPAITISPDAPLAAAARRMTQHHIRLLPVVTPEGDLMGVVSRRNLLSIFLRTDDDIAGEVRTVLGDLLLIDEATVTVSARDGMVTLAGLVADDDSRRAAIRVAGEIDGVAQVTSELTVQTSAGQPSAQP
jgi:CBS-domain-containing membrane protein